MQPHMLSASVSLSLHDAVHTNTSHTSLNGHLLYIDVHVDSFFFLIPLGEDRLHQLPEPLLCGHRGGDEGDLYLQPHVEAV